MVWDQYARVYRMYPVVVEMYSQRNECQRGSVGSCPSSYGVFAMADAARYFAYIGEHSHHVLFAACLRVSWRARPARMFSEVFETYDSWDMIKKCLRRSQRCVLF